MISEEILRAWKDQDCGYLRMVNNLVSQALIAAALATGKPSSTEAATALP